MLATSTYSSAIKSSTRMRRKILMIHCEYKQYGGESAVVQEEVKLLEEDGNTVSLLQFNNRKKTLWKLIQLPFNITSYITTIKKIKEFTPDVVHIHNMHFTATSAIIYAVKRFSIPVVVTLHNFRLLCPSATLYFNGQPFLKSLSEKFSFTAVKKGVYQNSKILTFWVAFSNWLHLKLGTFQMIDKFIVLSQHASSLFENSNLKIKKERLIIKPNFVSQPQNFSRERKDHFLFVGRLCKEKGIEILLDAFSKTGYEIRIAGDGPYKETVMKYSREFGNIKYLGILQKAQVYSEMQYCTALVFPSLWYEGMPLTIIESFACKTAVIASNIGAMAVMVKNDYNGLHFDTASKVDFTVKLIKWHSLNTIEKKEYGDNAYNTYQRLYTPEKNSELLTSIYDSLGPLQYKLSVS